MSPQHLVSTYSEQFAPPAGARPAAPRPSSAHRRNNPHPRPDFLVPLRRPYRSPRATANAVSSVGRPLFPQVRHLSFQEAKTDSSQTGKLPHISFMASSATLPSAGRLEELQHKATGLDYQVHTNLKRLRSASDSQRRLHTASYPVAPQNHRPQAQHRRFPRTSTLDSCGGYSCFTVVKPFQAGHFIIHPEFVSEYLRPAHMGKVNNTCY